MGMPKVGFVIGAFAITINVLIYTGSRVNGRWVQNPTPTELTIRGNPQAAGGKFLRFLPEGTRLEDTQVIYTQGSVPIDDAQTNGGQNDIQFILGGKPYRLIKTPQDWTNDYRIYLAELLRSNNAVPNI